MTGLEKILAQINADTDSICADIKKRADERCADIINSAHVQADEIRTTAQARASAQTDEIIKRAHSSAQLQRRSVLLTAKQQILSDSLFAAFEYLCSLPQTEYFKLIYAMIAKYSEQADGEILFCSKDIGRLPADFEDKASSLAKGKIIVSNEVADIKGGFILKYGGIEVNCAFESIFVAENERFTDAAAEILFSHGRSL